MKWNKQDVPKDAVRELAAKYGCDLCTASILIRRGVTRGEELLYYFENGKRFLRSPFDLPAMENAVERIIQAFDANEKILVFGDRDSDGITSLVIITAFLRSLGLDVTWRLPQNDEPYGLTLDAVDDAAKNGISLIITVDCGISNFDEIVHANSLGIDVVITDHHKPHEQLPAALAIVDPKLTNSAGAPLYPFQDLAGCGVAYKFAQATRFARKSAYYGRSICLLNVTPANGDSFSIEIIKTRNLARIARLTEVVIPGAVSITDTRIPRFLEGQEIFVYNAPAQKAALQRIFGRGVEFGLFDIAPLIAEVIPKIAGKSLTRLRDISLIAHYHSEPLSETDVLYNLFVSCIDKKEGLFTSADDEDLQLAATGTIADLMPLQDENRIIVKEGIASLKSKPRPGIGDLIAKLGLNLSTLTSTDISWQVTPVINSAGRLGEADVPVKLLLSEDKNEREALVNHIITLNNERRNLADRTWELVYPRAAQNLPAYANNIAFAAGDDIKRGVTGVMANRLSNKYNLPSLILSYNDDIVTGSMRSTRGYDLQGILALGSDLFIDAGGHEYAAGFSLKKEHVDEFLSRLQEFSKTIELKDEATDLEIDAELPLEMMTPSFVTSIVDGLEPFGKGNNEIIFLARGMRIVDITFLGKPETKHAKLLLDAGRYKWPALFWGKGERVSEEFHIGQKVDALFVARRNFFNGVENLQLVLNDLRDTEKTE
jgi:single-stranded-DNA-specific exonuclease